MNKRRKSDRDQFFKYDKGKEHWTNRGICGKLCYRSRGHAESHVKNLVTSGRDYRSETLEAYHCHQCNAWHTGNSNRGVQPR